MSKFNTSSSGLVFSSEHGRMCPKCQKPLKSCACKAFKSAPPSDGIVRIQRETKGRKGKGVTLVTGVPFSGDELKKLARQLKQRCGTGGTIKDGIIEIQGDHRDVLLEELKKHGWTVKKAGG